MDISEILQNVLRSNLNISKMYKGSLIDKGRRLEMIHAARTFKVERPRFSCYLQNQSRVVNTMLQHKASYCIFLESSQRPPSFPLQINYTCKILSNVTWICSLQKTIVKVTSQVLFSHVELMRPFSSRFRFTKGKLISRKYNQRLNT